MAHPVTDSLVGQTNPAVISRMKVDAFVRLPNVVNTVTVGAYIVLLVVAPHKAANNCLEFNVKITKGGLDVTPANMNPVQIYNPPICVPNPSGDIVGPDGNYAEDLHACLLDIASRLVAGLP